MRIYDVGVDAEVGSNLLDQYFVQKLDQIVGIGGTKFEGFTKKDNSGANRSAVPIDTGWDEPRKGDRPVRDDLIGPGHRIGM